MSRHLIVHQYCFQSSNSLWAVLHMPEEREQRIHYVYTMSDCRPVQDDARQGATTSNDAWREDTPYSIVADVLHVGVKRDPTNFSTPAMRDTTDFFSRPRRVHMHDNAIQLPFMHPVLEGLWHHGGLAVLSSHEWPQWSPCCILEHSRSCPAIAPFVCTTPHPRATVCSPDPVQVPSRLRTTLRTHAVSCASK